MDKFGAADFSVYMEVFVGWNKRSRENLTSTVSGKLALFKCCFFSSCLWHPEHWHSFHSAAFDQSKTDLSGCWSLMCPWRWRLVCVHCQSREYLHCRSLYYLLLLVCLYLCGLKPHARLSCAAATRRQGRIQGGALAPTAIWWAPVKSLNNKCDNFLRISIF